jgi:hypothetical protein
LLKNNLLIRHAGLVPASSRLNDSVSA